MKVSYFETGRYPAPTTAARLAGATGRLRPGDSAPQAYQGHGRARPLRREARLRLDQPVRAPLFAAHPDPVAAAVGRLSREPGRDISIALLGPIVPPATRFASPRSWRCSTRCPGRFVSACCAVRKRIPQLRFEPKEARERTDEGMELILKAWSEPQPFGWQGRYFQYRTVSIWPRPQTEPTARPTRSGSAPRRPISPRATTRAGRVLWHVRAHGQGHWLLPRALRRVRLGAGAGRHHLPRQHDPRRDRRGGRCQLARRSASQAPFPISQGLRNALIEQDKRNVGGQQRPANVGGVLPISFCGGPDRIIEQIRRAREEIGVGVLDLSLADPGTGGTDAMMESLDLFGRRCCRASARFDGRTSRVGPETASGFSGWRLPRGVCRGGRVSHPLLRGRAGPPARASARGRRSAPQCRARSAGDAVPRHHDRDARLRPIRGEHPDRHDRGAGDDDRQGRRRARSRPFRPDGDLVRRQGRFVARDPEPRTGPRAGARSPGRDPPPGTGRRASLRHARANDGPALRPPGAEAGHCRRWTRACRQNSSDWSHGCVAPTAMRSWKRRCAGSTRRPWCCSERSTA